MKEHCFQDKILSLVNLKQEGPYWDFKREWHTNQDDLLIDIICFANNLEDRDAYIIIGVDEEKGFSICDVRNTPNRRNTQNIVDFLRTKSFAGDLRPTVTVESINICESEIDVITIHNSAHTPFYITKQYKSVRPFHIYTRVQDTNTPQDSSADLIHVEHLWKKRFGLTANPLERIKQCLLYPEDWQVSPSTDTKSYYRISPEYTIEYSLYDERNGYEYYLFSQTDYFPRYTTFQLSYHQTVLAEVDGVILDGGRCVTPTGLWDGLSFSEYGNWDVSYKYLIKDSIEDIIAHFYQHEADGDAQIAFRRFRECLLVFESEEEHLQFREYAVRHYQQQETELNTTIRTPYVPEIEGKTVFEERYKSVQVLRRMLERFRSE